MAKKKLAVGVSTRTPGKHDALDKISGKTIGAFASKRFNWRKLFMLDCTAGDGVPSEFSSKTSPGILNNRAEFLEERKLAFDLTFYEQSPVTAASLKERFPSRNVVCGDAVDMPKVWDSNSVVFVVNDPNTVNRWALPKSLASAPKFTTVFSTLGCNVGGLKKISKEARQSWYDHVEAQLSLLQPWHAAYLVRIERDASQWAYLVNSPVVWMEFTEDAFNRAFAKHGMTVDGGWSGAQIVDQSKFDYIRDELFLTKKERGA